MVASDHHADEVALVRLGDRLRVHEVAVTQHGDPVGQLEDLDRGDG